MNDGNRINRLRRLLFQIVCATGYSKQNPSCDRVVVPLALCRVRVVPRGASLELEAGGVSWSFTVGCATFFVSVEYRMPAMKIPLPSSCVRLSSIKR
jgi:hypothetical protein